MTGETNELLERFLFDLTEPPYSETDETLSAQFRNNLVSLWEAEGRPAGWHPDNHAVDAADVRQVIDERERFLELGA